MKRIITKFRKSHFAKNVLILMTGTGLAQLISFVLSPVISRLYGPEEFGVFALFISIVSILGIFATGRFEMAIMLPKEEKEVNKIIAVISIFTFSICLIAFLSFLLFADQILLIFNNPGLKNWLLIIPFAIFLNSLYQTLTYLLIRTKSFKRLSFNKIIHSSITSSGQLGLGLLKYTNAGLIIPNLIAFSVTSLMILKNGKIRDYFNLNFIGINETLRKYKQFPIFDLPAMSLNLASSQLPIFALGKIFGLASVGYYSFTFKILTTPLNLLSNSVLDVFKQRATEDFNKYGNCTRIFLNTTRYLVFVAILPFLILGIYGTEIFSFVFGREWSGAGLYSQILAPMFFFKFVASPLSYVFTIRNKQNYNLIGQLSLALLTLLAFVIGYLKDDEKLTLYLFTSFYVLVYSVYFWLSFKLSKGSKT